MTDRITRADVTYTRVGDTRRYRVRASGQPVGVIVRTTTPISATKYMPAYQTHLEPVGPERFLGAPITLAQAERRLVDAFNARR